MLDINQIVHTKEAAEAIKYLAGLFIKPEQLKQIEVIDRANKKHYVAPGLITRMMSTEIYNPTRAASIVYYVNGDTFKVDLETQELARQLNICR